MATVVPQQGIGARLHHVQGEVGVLHLTHSIEVNGRHTINGHGSRLQSFTDNRQRVRQTADDAFLRRVDDHESRMRHAVERRANLLRRLRKDDAPPARRLRVIKPPRALQGVAFGVEITPEQIRRAHSTPHLVGVGPGARREQARRFAKAVADHARRSQTDVAQQIVCQDAIGDLREDHAPHVLAGPRRGVPLPALGPVVSIGREPVNHAVRGQMGVLSIERSNHVRPLRRNLPPHPDEVIPRPGKHKRNPRRPCIEPRVAHPFKGGVAMIRLAGFDRTSIGLQRVRRRVGASIDEQPSIQRVAHPFRGGGAIIDLSGRSRRGTPHRRGRIPDPTAPIESRVTP